MSHRQLGVVVLVWLVLAAIGIGAMLDFELTPAQSAKATTAWPADSQLKRDRHRPTLVMFIHPHCPCSRASLAELGVVAANSQGQADLHVLIIKPHDFDDGWEKTDLLASAKSIPSVTVHIDNDGAEAARFGAATSGETMLFDCDGRRLFRGGITVSRGHEGDNPGVAALAALLHAGRASVDATPVYGCSLFNRCTRDEDSERQCKP
ncbi:MAG TPA: hypothetical protein VKB78_14020 [Pirellulales bacterium]|nr:hypothetical protein [Pirellulales bacterium]